MKRRSLDHSIIDMSLWGNLGIREHKKTWMSKHLPVGRPRDIIAAIAAVIGGIISAILPETAGFVILGTYFSIAGIAYGIAAGIVIAAVIGLTVWSMSGGKKGAGGGIERSEYTGICGIRAADC